MKNTLAGYWGFESILGNQFGEHAYWIFILLLPIKFLMGNNMHYFLIFYSPLYLFISSVFIFFFLKDRIPIIYTIFVSIIYLLCFGTSTRGIFEAIYGFHPDIAAGFCLIIITLLLIRRDENFERYQSSKNQYIMIAFYIILVSTKQEMALLATGYFSLLYAFRKDSYYLKFSLISFLLFVCGMLHTYFSQTEFNRGNDTLLIILYENIQNQGLHFFLQTKVTSFFLKILLIACAFLGARISSFYRNDFAFALFITGIIKSLLSLISNDFSIYSWHNYPCFILITGAIVIQCSDFISENSKYIKAFILIAFIISIGIFFKADIGFLKQRIRLHEFTEPIVARVSPRLNQLKKLVPRDQIVSVPLMTAVEWADYTYIFYPGGIYGTSKGRADYVITTKANTGIPMEFFHLKYYIHEDTIGLKKEFIMLAENKYFALHKRIAYTKDSLSAKKKFFREFNLSTPLYTN